MRKQMISIIILGMFLLTSVISLSATGINSSKAGTLECNKTIYVDDDAALGGDGSADHPFDTIQEAVFAANDGDTVFVYSGTYVEEAKYYDVSGSGWDWVCLWVNKSIDLIGENKENTIITGQGIDFIDTRADLVRFKADYITMSGFTVTYTDWQTSGIQVFSDYNDVYDNIITDIDGSGIELSDNAEYNKVHDNIIYHNSWGRWAGIYLEYSKYNEIYMNEIYDHPEWGIVLIYAEDNKIYNNNIRNSEEKSVHMWYSIKDNFFMGNYYDDYVGFDSDGDGYGDVPYNINPTDPKIEDRRPKMDPVEENLPLVALPLSFCVEKNENLEIQAVAAGGVKPWTFKWDLDNDGEFDDAEGQTIQKSWDSECKVTIKVKMIDANENTITASSTVTVTKEKTKNVNIFEIFLNRIIDRVPILEIFL